MAAAYEFNADKEMTVFTGRIHTDNLEPYYELFKNHLLNPAFKEDDFERVKSQMVNYLERTYRYSRDEELSKDLLMSKVFAVTPYEHLELGSVSSVKALTLDDVKQFYADYYVANNIVVGIGGGYPGGMVQRLRDDFNTLPTKELPEAPIVEPVMPDGIHVLIVKKNAGASPVSIGFPISFIRGDGDYYSMSVMNSWFGEHRNSFSHLYQVIREARGMNYGDYSYIEAFPAGFATQQPRVNCARKHQIFEIWLRPIAQTAPGNLNDRVLFAMKAALRELKDLVDNGMTEEEFQTAKNFYSNYCVKFGSTISRRLGYAIDDEFFGLEEGYLASMRAGIDAVTLEQVNAAIKEHLQYDNMWIVMITDDPEDMKEKLLTNATTNISYSGEKPQEQLDEDLEIANFPITVKEENIKIIDISEVFE
jgi:zinc protease